MSNPCPMNVWNHTNGCDCATRMAGSPVTTAAFPADQHTAEADPAVSPPEGGWSEDPTARAYEIEDRLAYLVPEDGPLDVGDGWRVEAVRHDDFPETGQYTALRYDEDGNQTGDFTITAWTSSDERSGAALAVAKSVTALHPEFDLAAVRESPAGVTARAACDRWKPGHLPAAAVNAAMLLEQDLPPVRSEALHKARMAYVNAGGRPGEANVLHAELVDALDAAPSRAEIADMRRECGDARMDRTYAQMRCDSLADRDPYAADELAAAEARVNEAERRLARATARRHDASRERIGQGRPTLYDMQEAQARRDEAHAARRTTVNAADAAREHYLAAERDSVLSRDRADVHRRALAVDEATRREFDAQAALDRAERELDAANSGWSRLSL